MALNYYAINKATGGRMVARKPVAFGNFRLLDVVGAALGARPHADKPVPFTYELDALVARAFEEVREGAAPERVLWDRQLASKFHSRARRLGVHAPEAQINRRLLAIRKDPERYQAHGIVLSPTTKSDPQASIVARYAHVIEFALVKLKCRHGASIDDILIDPKLTQEYEELATSAVPDITSTQLRLGALYIRKTRHVAKNKAGLFDDLDTAAIEQATEEIGTLASLSLRDVPKSEGLVEVLERDKYLYIARNENLYEVVEQMANGTTMKLLSNDFWKPEPEAIGIKVFRGARFQETSIRDWQLKLIREKDPVFNWPVQAA